MSRRVAASVMGFPGAHASSVKLALRVDDQTINGETVAIFFLNILAHLDDAGLLHKLTIPMTTSGDNFLLADEPSHPSGRQFYSFAEYEPRNGAPRLFININHPRFFALRQGARMLRAAGLRVTLPES